MQQRVALAQAMIMKPKVLLLDEPFGALDEYTREKLQHMLLSLYQENLKSVQEHRKPEWTIVFVTHELNEAFYIADRIVGLTKMHGDGPCPPSSTSTGAEIVWDKSCHVFGPHDKKDFTIFEEEKERLKRVVLEGQFNPPKTQHVTFWSTKKTGVAGLHEAGAT